MATDDKYDRQLRLWGAHGQRALGQAKICFLVGEGSGALATETLKNLVLPGIGEFVIVDGAVVSERDLGSNFFVEGEALGTSRADCCTRLLKELNPDVKGSFVAEPVAKVVNERPEFLHQFQVVIGCRLDESLQLKVEEICRAVGVPLLLQNILGFFGQLRLCLQEHCVIEGKPDVDPVDLRMLNPFPQLVELVKKVDLNAMDDAQHAHVPYVRYDYCFLTTFQKRNKVEKFKVY
jgi:amyloid beta precursor protein binding protein 1